MRVLFDGFWWVGGPTSNSHVMREFVLAWARVFPGDRLTVAVRSSDRATVRQQLPDGISVVGLRARPHALAVMVELPVVARRIRPDVMVTHNFAPLVGRGAVFVHDVMFMTEPSWFTRAERAYFALMPWTLPRALRVFSSSRTEASRIRRLVRLRNDVESIGLGVARSLLRATPKSPAGFTDGKRFILSVGRLNARKNVATAIEAALDSGIVSRNVPLVIVGEPQGLSAVLPPFVREAVDSGAVIFLGFVDDAELAWLYGAAAVFLFLSLDEGFGMPLLEALAFGVPVVASDIAVFREIAGDRVRYVPPLDIPAIATAIATAFVSGRNPPVEPSALGYGWEESVRRMRHSLT